MLPLAGLNVVEFAGLAPGPFVGMLLADFGASVIRIDRPGSRSDDVLARGKRSIALSLKSKEGLAIALKLLKDADVVIDPFRPGVLERIGLGPEVIDKASSGRAILARLTGFPRSGPWSDRAGHDINYLALSGILSLLKPPDSPTPVPPVNLLADFAGGSVMCVVGILLALLERSKSGKGQVVEADMVNGVRYLSSFALLNNIPNAGTPFWSQPVGQNVLDGGSPFYGSYACKDGLFMSVGALEPQFFSIFIDIMLANAPLKQKTFDKATIQADQKRWPALKAYLKEAFASKTRDSWTALFEKTDACVTPVLSLEESAVLWSGKTMDDRIPPVAPRLTRTPGIGDVQSKYENVGKKAFLLPPGSHSVSILADLGYSTTECDRLAREGAVEQYRSIPVKAKL